MNAATTDRSLLRWPSRLLLVAVVLLILARPATLFPVAKNQCDFCFRQATGSLTYSAPKTGETMRLAVCDSHRKSAASRLTALDVSYFKLIAWLVMLGPLGFALYALARAVFASTHRPLELGCAVFALVPLLVGQLLYLVGLHTAGRILGWLAVFGVFAAAMGITTGSLSQPVPPQPGQK